MKQLLLLSILVLLTGVGCLPETTTILPTVNQTTRLDYRNQGLSSVPMEIFSRTQAQELDLSNNQLTGALPSQLNQLKQLRVLNASNNQFTGIPAEIGQLANLEVVDFSNNQLTGLPLELGNLSHLKLLDLSGNNVSTVDLDAIRAQLPNETEIRIDPQND